MRDILEAIQAAIDKMNDAKPTARTENQDLIDEEIAVLTQAKIDFETGWTP